MPRTTLLIDRLIPVAQLVRAQWEDGGLRFPPTDVFNKKWLLRALLDAFERYNQNEGDPLCVPPDAHWLTDVKLESPFAPRFPGDHLGEESPTVSAVIGNFEPPSKPGEPLRLLPGCRTFTVIEAFLYDLPSDGVPGFPWYNRIAQIAACMAHTLHVSGIGSTARMKRTLAVLMPRSLGRNSEAIGAMTNPALVRGLVTSRVNAYRGEDEECMNARYDWLHDCFLRFHKSLRIAECDWEMAMTDSGRFDKIFWFFAGCMCFGNPDGPKAGRCFSRTPRDMPRAKNGS